LSAKSALPWWHTLITLALGFVFGYYAYFAGPPSGFNSYQAAGSLLFWYSLAYLVYTFALRGTFSLFVRYVRSKLGAVSAALYASFHLLLYGFILEYIFVRVYAPNFSIPTTAVFVNTNLVFPLNPSNILLGFSFSPSVTLSVPPIFGAVLSLYSFFSSFILATLVVANVGLTREIGRCGLGLKARTYVALPAVGVTLGVSCCLSPPLLLALVAPVTAAVTYSLPAYYTTYFTFPPLAMLALYLNQRSVARLRSNLVRRVGVEANRPASLH